MDLIPDPFDEQEALMLDGRMAGKVFLVPCATFEAPNSEDLNRGKFVGWCDPKPMSDLSAPSA